MSNGMTVRCEERRVHLGAAIAEDDPLIADFADGVEIERVRDHAFARLVGLFDEFAELVRDEGGAVESQLATSEIMRKLLKKAERLAASDYPVLIVGETGTGKELVANLIPERSARWNRPFVALNCGALPPTLIESTLFRAVKGAYTGAENASGNIELANGGTLFLDELNSLPIESQAKLLRFLQDKSYYKVGGTKELHADVRIVAAMNELPQELMDDHRLRPDLFYRLEIGMLYLPPLRERREEILPLAELFCRRFSEDNQMPPIGISPSARRELLEYDWSGNIRMLENVILRSLLLKEPGDTLSKLIFNDPAAAPAKADKPAAPFPPRLESSSPSAAHDAASMPSLPLEEVVGAFERNLIVQALTASRGRVAAAARMLCVSRGALQYKIRKYGITLTAGAV